MTDKDLDPTDLGTPEPPPRGLDGTALEEQAGLGGELDLNMMIALARRIADGHPVRSRVPMETLIRSLAQTVVKLADQQEGEG